jgi:hypothetical protein
MKGLAVRTRATELVIVPCFICRQEIGGTERAAQAPMIASNFRFPVPEVRSRI